MKKRKGDTRVCYHHYNQFTNPRDPLSHLDVFRSERPGVLRLYEFRKSDSGLMSVRRMHA